ncbi:MAG: lipid A biosynthesis acyltransferase [Weeksellaceae bacterium]
MKSLLYRFLFSVLYLISMIPLKLLYGFSEVLYFVIYYIVGYRKQIVYENLRKSFPEKPEEDILKIRKKFYRNFADYLVETLKSFSISQQELDRRHTYSNLEVFDECKKEGKNVIMITGHVFNWEWYIGLVKYLPTQKTYALYHKVKNEFWNDRVSAIREKFGTNTLDMHKSVRFMLVAPQDGEQTYLFVADQSPQRDEIRHSIRFLNQETPVYLGFDKIAAKKNMAVVFCKTVKKSQGHYHTEFERIRPKNRNFEPHEVLNEFFSRLENQIIEHPDNWLWSHRRWKNAKGEHY